MASVNLADSSAVSETVSFLFPPTVGDSTTMTELFTLDYVWANVRKTTATWTDMTKN